jgi:hypothetical protein
VSTSGKSGAPGKGAAGPDYLAASQQHDPHNISFAGTPSPPSSERAAAGFGGKPSAPRAKIRRFAPFRSAAGKVLGFVSAETPAGMVIDDLKLMIGPKSKSWVALPSAKQVDQDGKTRLDANGEAIWRPSVEFRTGPLATAFRK